MKLRSTLFIATLLGGLLAPLSAVPDAAAATAPPGGGIGTPPGSGTTTAFPDYTSHTSTLWSGWVDAVDSSSIHLRHVAADMTVRKVTCSQNGEEAGFWVGLDGQTDATVEQTGIIAYCDGTHAEYYSFYEMYPQNPVLGGSVSPGDHIEMSVYYASSDGQFDLSLTDKNNNAANLYAPMFCPAGSKCLRRSAEVIVEDVNGAPHHLPDFGTVDFTDISVTSQDGTHGTLEGNSLWNSHAYILEYKGSVMAQPGSRTDGYTAFKDTWRSAG